MCIYMNENHMPRSKAPKNNGQMLNFVIEKNMYQNHFFFSLQRNVTPLSKKKSF